MSKTLIISTLLLPSTFLSANLLQEQVIQIYPEIVAPISPHSIVPSFEFVKYENELMSGDLVGIGVEYRYEKPHGYNCKVGYVFHHDNKREGNYHFHFWNAYKIPTLLESFSIYPMAILESSAESFCFKPWYNDRSLYVNSLSLGMGVENIFADVFKVGLDILISRDIKRFASLRSTVDNTNWSWHLNKQTGLNIFFPLQYRFHRKSLIEIGAFYSKSLNRSIYKGGARLSILFNI